MAISFSAETLSLLEGRNYAVLATINPGGARTPPRCGWASMGDDLLFSTVEGRVKHRNMLRDPRVSVTVWDSADPEIAVDLRGGCR